MKLSRVMLAAACIAMLPVTGHAQDGLLVEACKRAIAHSEMNNEWKAVEVNDFSNLKPPRVRMKIGGVIKDGKMEIMGALEIVRCTFSSTTKPVGLRELCPRNSLCISAGNQRFDEVVELLRRDGY